VIPCHSISCLLPSGMCSFSWARGGHLKNEQELPTGGCIMFALSDASAVQNHPQNHHKIQLTRLIPVSNKLGSSEIMKSIGGLLLITVVAQTARPAWAGQIRGELYPEKQTYLVGEPVFVALDLTNPGPQAVWISRSCVWLDTGFEAPTAPKRHQGVSLFGWTGGVAGSCGGSAIEIGPEKHYTRRSVLDGPFRLDAPGVYPIRAWHKVDIYAGETGFQVVASHDVVSEFDLTFIGGTEKELASVYAPILRDLKSPDPETSWLARSAVLQNPPSFLENVILAMAEDPQTAAASVSGLERLATPRAKAALAKLSATGNPEAITALGGLGDPAYCSLMLDIAQESREYSRFIALRAAGYLCGEEAFPLLTSRLHNPEYSTRFEAAYALGNTHSRDAVALLIPLLRDADPNVRRAARDALAALTHRRSKRDEGPAEVVHRDWHNWWTSNATTAPIYGIDQCKEPEPFE
jgi:HEAT repeat protein